MTKPNVIKLTPYLFELVWTAEPDRELLMQMLAYQDQIKETFGDRLVTVTMGFQRIGLLFNKSIAASELEKTTNKIRGPGEKDKNQKTWNIPLLYDGRDLESIAKWHKCSISSVIKRHSHTDYLLYFYGFLPGFPYLIPANKKSGCLAIPRKTSPDEIQTGEVGLAEKQCGVYPANSPGGWQILGRTPVKFLQLESNQPTFVQPGDVINFYPIDKEEFDSWRRENRKPLHDER